MLPSTLRAVRNLAVVCGDAAAVLADRISTASVDNIFVNHPEPPERTGGTDDSQGQHLYTDPVLNEMRRCLKDGGTLTIATDNRPYAESLAAAVARVGPDLTFKSAKVRRSQGVYAKVDGVEVHIGDPSKDQGHVADSSSYFDRLWSNGKKKGRWFLFLRAARGQGL